MAIESDVSLTSMPKVKNPGTYSRAVESRTKIFSDKPTTVIVVKDWEDKDAAQKVLSKRSVGVAYDPSNPDHVTQWQKNGGLDAEGNEVAYDPNDLDANGNPWKPTVLEEYWDGSQTVKPPFQTREIELPLELALAVAKKAVTGKPLEKPQDSLEAMTAQTYLALMSLPEFGENMKAV